MFKERENLIETLSINNKIYKCKEVNNKMKTRVKGHLMKVKGRRAKVRVRGHLRRK